MVFNSRNMLNVGVSRELSQKKTTCGKVGWTYPKSRFAIGICRFEVQFHLDSTSKIRRSLPWDLKPLTNPYIRMTYTLKWSTNIYQQASFKFLVYWCILYQTISLCSARLWCIPSDSRAPPLSFTLRRRSFMTQASPSLVQLPCERAGTWVKIWKVNKWHDPRI